MAPPTVKFVVNGVMLIIARVGVGVSVGVSGVSGVSAGIVGTIVAHEPLSQVWPEEQSVSEAHVVGAVSAGVGRGGG